MGIWHLMLSLNYAYLLLNCILISYCILSGPFYLAQGRMTRSPRLHFNYSFALYYIYLYL
jgi:hypothetical protein